MTFIEFKTALRNYEENEKSCNPRSNQDNVMFSKQRFTGKCFKCDKQGHKSTECRMKTEKWCVKSRSKTHDTKAKDCRANKKDAVKAVAEPGKDDSETHTFTFTLQETSENLKKTQETRRRHDEDPSLLVDTDATSRIVTDRSKCVSFDDNFDTNTHIIELADGSKTSIVLGKGNAKVKLYDVKGNLHEVMLSNALYVPSYQKNIFSVSAEVEKGGNVNLGPQVSIYTTEEGREFEIKRKGRLYFLNSISSSTNNARTIHEWHIGS